MFANFVKVSKIAKTFTKYSQVTDNFSDKSKK